jgi:hypothetical protein
MRPVARSLSARDLLAERVSPAADERDVCSDAVRREVRPEALTRASVEPNRDTDESVVRPAMSARQGDAKSSGTNGRTRVAGPFALVKDILRMAVGRDDDDDDYECGRG